MTTVITRTKKYTKMKFKQKNKEEGEGGDNS